MIQSQHMSTQLDFRPATDDVTQFGLVTFPFGCLEFCGNIDGIYYSVQCLRVFIQCFPCSIEGFKFAFESSRTERTLEKKAKMGRDTLKMSFAI